MELKIETDFVPSNAVEAALLAVVREQQAVIERVKRANKELFDISDAPDFGNIQVRAAYRDASRAIRAALTASEDA